MKIEIMRRVLLVVTSIIMTNFGLPANAANESNGYIPQEPRVTTVAGNGQLGVVGGAALSANFIEPAGIAVGRDGTIYVTDLGAQDIREIKDGVVRTVAGTSSPGKFAIRRVGGYQDGPAATARFFRPSGIAVGADGALYVADELNGCIRKIYHGIVSTYAGSPHNEAKDGPRGEGGGGLQFPRGIAIDDDGNLYVAAFGKGIKKVTPDGTISTLSYPNDSWVSSIAVKGAGKNLIVAYADRTAVHLIADDVHLQATFVGLTEQGNPVGTAFGVAILSNHAVAVTDLESNAVRFIRFPYGSVTGIMTRSLAGGIREGFSSTSGYRDGTSGQALTDIPYGIATRADGSLFFTDSGNRRIREITNLDARTPSGAELPASAPADRYRIALVGASEMFYSTFWPESFAGPIETKLKAHGVADGMRKQPCVCSSIRLDGADYDAERSLISNYFGDGQVDLVVLFTSRAELNGQLNAHPELSVNDKWKTAIAPQLSDLGASLAKHGTSLLLVVIPQGEQVSPLERVQRIEDGAGPAYDFVGLAKEGAELEDALASSHIKTIKLLAPMQRFEDSSGRYQLFNNFDPHLSIQGSTWVGQRVADELLQWKPWLTKP